MVRQINVFISHSWSHSGHYDTLQSWIFGGAKAWTVQDRESLTGQSSLAFYDKSVPKNDPIHTGGNAFLLESAILTKILDSHVIVIPMGMYVNYSEWIRREINIAIRCNKPKLAVDPWGQKRSSSIVRENSDEEAGWNQKSIIEKIWQLYNRPSWQLRKRVLS